MFQMKTEQTVEPLLLTVRQAAKVLSISERSLFTLTKAGEIPIVRIGRSVRYDVGDLRAWIASAKKIRWRRKPLDLSRVTADNGQCNENTVYNQIECATASR